MWKVEGIGEIVIVTHDGVKRKLGDVRYVLKLERNLISLGRLESKGCTFKASDGLLKVIKGSMVLMRGRRSQSNLYVLQVDGGFLGRNDGCKSPKKVTFDNDERFGLEGEIVVSSSKSHHDGGKFDHLIAYSLACTFENEVVSARKYESICFGSINKLIDEDELECFNEGKARRSGGFEDRSTSRAKMQHQSSEHWTAALPERHAAPEFVSFCFCVDFVWALSPFVQCFSNMFYGYIRSLRSSLGYWRGTYKSES